MLRKLLFAATVFLAAFLVIPMETMARGGRGGGGFHGGGGRGGFHAAGARGFHGGYRGGYRGGYGGRRVVYGAGYRRGAYAAGGVRRGYYGGRYYGRGYYGGRYYGAGRYWGGRYWAYGSGACWRWNPATGRYFWVCR